jgi:hypothetical protein
MSRFWLVVGLFLAGVLTVVAFVWMGQLVGAGNSACEKYPYTSGCR